MTLAFDGTNYWDCSGGSTAGVRLGNYTSAGALIATVNEDVNSSLYTIRAPRKVTHYTYSPAPDSSTAGGVRTGGGTDAVSVYNGQIIVSASNPGTPDATAAFVVRHQGESVGTAVSMAKSRHCLHRPGSRRVRGLPWSRPGRRGPP